MAEAQISPVGQEEFVAMIHAQNEQCAMAVEQRAGNHQALAGACPLRTPSPRPWPAEHALRVPVPPPPPPPPLLLLLPPAGPCALTARPDARAAWGAGLLQLAIMTDDVPRKKELLRDCRAKFNLAIKVNSDAITPDGQLAIFQLVHAFCASANLSLRLRAVFRGGLASVAACWERRALPAGNRDCMDAERESARDARAHTNTHT